jgi:hypothetical protein
MADDRPVLVRVRVPCGRGRDHVAYGEGVLEVAVGEDVEAEVGDDYSARRYR